MNRLIIFLIRKKLGVKLFETFRFTNQKTSDVYWFTQYSLMKVNYYPLAHGKPYQDVCFSGVSLNWLLSDECEIEKINL